MDPTRKGWLDRALSPLAEVRAGEGAGALLLALNVFALFAMYYILKTVRESLILSEGGAEVKSYAAAGQAALLLAFVPAYGALASRVNRVVLINGVTIFFASHLFIFYLLGAAGVHIGLAFFLWTGIFAVVLPAQFWAFANDLYDTERGKRLFPIVGVGTALGAWGGAALASVLFSMIFTRLKIARIGTAAAVPYVTAATIGSTNSVPRTPMYLNSRDTTSSCRANPRKMTQAKKRP